MKKFIFSLLTLAFFAGFSFSNGHPAQGSNAASDSGGAESAPRASAERPYTFTIGLTGDIAGLEPGLAYDPNTIPVLSQITDNLVKRLADGGREPYLAKEIETPNDTTYIYKLRDDVTFSDGAPLTADDVVWSLQRYADPDGGALQQWNYENVLLIEKTGDLEVTIKLKQPSNVWKHVPAANAGYISSKKHFEETG